MLGHLLTQRTPKTEPMDHFSFHDFSLHFPTHRSIFCETSFLRPSKPPSFPGDFLAFPGGRAGFSARHRSLQVYILTELITGGELHGAIREIPTVLSRWDRCPVIHIVRLILVVSRSHSQSTHHRAAKRGVDSDRRNGIERMRRHERKTWRCEDLEQDSPCIEDPKQRLDVEYME